MQSGRVELVVVEHFWRPFRRGSHLGWKGVRNLHTLSLQRGQGLRQGRRVRFLPLLCGRSLLATAKITVAAATGTPPAWAVLHSCYTIAVAAGRQVVHTEAGVRG